MRPDVKQWGTPAILRATPVTAKHFSLEDWRQTLGLADWNEFMLIKGMLQRNMRTPSLILEFKKNLVRW